MDWIGAHWAVLEWTAAHIGIPVFAAIGGFVAARWTDRLKRKTDEQRATVQMAMHLAEYVRHSMDEFTRLAVRGPDPTVRAQWDAEIIASPLKDAKAMELVPGLRASARNALLELHERVSLSAAEIKRVHRWQEDDVDTDAPVILAEFILAVDAVLQMVRKQAGIPALPEGENGISYIRNWLPERQERIRKRNAERLADQLQSSRPDDFTFVFRAAGAFENVVQ
jgi:hypothetical protein